MTERNVKLINYNLKKSDKSIHKALSPRKLTIKKTGAEETNSYGKKRITTGKESYKLT